ncbi:MAG TPA: LamG-like jellyroll fold domain-containing protein [Candidatus Sulfotelmatobacter sp.]|nr:LamG-like jellyroll fold domain-containing protein [Candidatus Sulfotelmatobacter sp.]
MVSGTQWPYGDPFLERQDEPSLAVSTRNPLHLLAGANDYRTVDLNLPEIDPGEPRLANTATGEPWVGQYMSIDGGAHWQSSLLPGYPQDTSARGMSSPLHGFTTAADPVIAAGTNGMFYYAGIAFNRGTSLGAVFVSRFMDLNNKENGNIVTDSFPIRYINTVPVAYGSNFPAQFLDKPWLAVDIPRSGGQCSFAVTQSNGTTVQQTIPAGNVYIAYANVSTSNGSETSTIYFSRSTNCGMSWSSPVAISHGFTLSQGATIQIDPETGIVYVAWRVIHSAQQPNDGIAITASLDGGRDFLPAIQLVSLPPFSFNNPTAPSFFDQNTTATSFRTTAYPAMAVADSGLEFIPGPLYIAWSQRGIGPNGEARIMLLPIPGNASFTSSGFKPPTPYPIDNGAVTNDEGGTFPSLTSGHQVMPTMTFNQGKLMVLYYDLRQDHTIGEFAPSVLNGVFTPDANGNFFEETRDQVAESPTSAYLPSFIDDAGLRVRRHTNDLVVAESNGGFAPSFTYARVSHYDFGLFEGETGGETAPFHQLKFDPPNLPMFMQGTGAFIGDYLGLAGQPFVLVKCGSSQCWTYNNPSPPGVAGSFLAAPKPAASSAVHYATWTSNQDVIPPANGRWDSYTAIASGTSVYDGTKTVPNCQPGNEGDRNQNVYMSRISQGLVVSSPQTSKPLSSTIERGFVILVQNQTTGRSTASGFVNYFRLTIANQPANGFASFAQFVPPSPVPPPPFPATNNGIAFPLTSVDVAIAPHTGVARTVFAVSSNPTANILINVTEISRLGGSVITGGLSAFILLNADGTIPANLVDPNGQSGSNSISNVELYDPNVSAPNVSAPNVSAPNVSAPNVSAPNVSAPNVSAPNVSAPNVSAPNVSAYGVANPNVSAPNVSAPNVSAAPPSDGTYSVTNNGNTTASYNLALTGGTSTPLQLLLSQIYMTPQTDGQCHLITQQQNITLSNVPNAPFTPVNQIANPNVSAAPVTQPTFSLRPGETAYITIRGNVDIPTMEQIVTQVAPVVVPQAVDSNNTTATTPPISAPLFITTSSLPQGIANQPYSATIQAIGGRPPYSWTVQGLPEGLTATPNTATTALIISGSTSATNGPVSFQVTDSGGDSAQTTTRLLNLVIVNPLTAVPQTFSTTQGFAYPPSATLTATGGLPPYTWTFGSGSLDGLTLNSNGSFAGIPGQSGTFPFTASVKDSSVPPQSASGSFTLQVDALPNIVIPTLPSGAVGLSYGPVQLTVTGGTSPFTWSVLPSTPLPAGMNLSSGGALSGTPSASGTFNFTVQVVDASGASATLPLTLVIAAAQTACSPTPAGLLSWYPFNGNALDIRGGRPGTVLGEGGQFVPAEVGQGFKSSGAGNVITVPSGQFLDPVNFSVGAWIRVDAITSDPTMQIVWQGDNLGTDLTTPYSLSVQGNGTFSTSPNAIVVGTPTAGKVLAIITDGANELDIFSSTVLKPGVFYYVTLTWNGSSIGANLYVNGVSENSGTGPKVVTASQFPFQIAGIVSGIDSFNGVINQLQIWGNALTQSQIAAIYNAGAAGECQNLWFTESNGTTNRIGMIAPSGTNAISEFTTPTANSFPFGIAAGPDGNVWFTENIPNNIGELAFVGGGMGIGEFAIPNGSGGAEGITSGPDGNLWFTEAAASNTPNVGSITTSGTVTLYPVPTHQSNPTGITAGPDGNLWFTENGSGKIARMTTGGSITEFSTPTSLSGPLNITVGPDGNLWFTESFVSKIGVITTAGTFVNEFPTPTTNSSPYGITLGPDGNVWFAESNANQVGRITPAGVVTEFPIPTADTSPLFITGGPDGNLWFTESGSGKIGRVTPSGSFTEFPTPTPSSGPWGITLGPAVAPSQAPNPPTNVTGTNSNGQGVISWTASTSPGVISYNVYRSTSASGPFTLVGSGVSGTSFTDNPPGACPPINYYYVVTAVGSGNVESVFSNVASGISAGGC